MTTKDFSLAAVLTVVTGRFLVGDIGELYDILNHMTGDNLFTHQLARAGEVCEKPLLAQHPQLGAVEVPDLAGDADAYKQWVANQEAIFGAMLSVEPLESWQHRDPVTELAEMIGGKPIMTVEAHCE
jgi:hypothetical protein